MYSNKYFLSCINLKVKSKPITPSSASSKTITTSSKTVTTSSASSKKITKTSTSKVREKKVYSLPGQKHDPPEQVLNLPYLVRRIHKLKSTYGIGSHSFLCFFFYDLCWQKEPLRIFYESLSKQIPTSEMAEFWWVFFQT